jgi:hypothetical protein
VRAYVRLSEEAGDPRDVQATDGVLERLQVAFLLGGDVRRRRREARVASDDEPGAGELQLP